MIISRVYLFQDLLLILAHINVGRVARTNFFEAVFWVRCLLRSSFQELKKFLESAAPVAWDESYYHPGRKSCLPLFNFCFDVFRFVYFRFGFLRNTECLFAIYRCLFLFTDSVLSDTFLCPDRCMYAIPFRTGVYPAHGSDGCYHPLPWSGLLRSVG